MNKLFPLILSKSSLASSSYLLTKPQFPKISAVCLLFNYQQERNAGHSKWQNIRHVKAANDQKKGQTSNKYVALIRVAVSSGGPDPKINTALADIIANAMKANVAKTTLDRAIKRAADSKVQRSYVEFMGPSSAIVLVECETDNLMRTKYELKKLAHPFKTFGMMKEGKGLHVFNQRGMLKISKKDKDGAEVTFERAEEVGIEAGAEEVVEDEEKEENDSSAWVLMTDVNEIYKVKGFIEKNLKQIEILEFDTLYVPNNGVQLSDEDMEKASSMFDVLNEHEEVNRIFTNIV